MGRQRDKRGEAKVGRNLQFIGKGEVHFARAQRGKQICLMPFGLREDHFGIPVRKTAAQARQQHLGDGLQTAHRQRSAQAAGDLTCKIGHPACRRQHALRFGHHAPPGVGQGQPLRVTPDEQLQAKLLLQLRDGGGNRG